MLQDRERCKIVTSFESFEHIGVLLRTPATMLRTGLLYRRPPSTENGLNATMFFNEFPILLERLVVGSGHLLLPGAVNFHIFVENIWVDTQDLLIGVIYNPPN